MENITLVKVILILVSLGIFFFIDTQAGFVSLILMNLTVIILEYRKRKMK
jgi:hypothetical protein